MARTETPARIARRLESSRRWFSLVPPEGVPIRFEIAGLAARFGAQLLDILITVVIMAAIIIVLAFLPFDIEPVVTSLAAILLLMIRAPYYILTELFWNGQTIGKRATGLRVLGADGRGLTTHAVVARNLMKEVEIFMPGTLLLASGGLGLFWNLVLTLWIAVVLIVPLANRKRQRLGDLIANTYVMVGPKSVLLPDLSSSTPTDAFDFTPAQLEHYGRFELQTLESLLRTETTTQGSGERRRESLIQVAAQIRRKIGYEAAVPDSRVEEFLHAFYTAQRAFLEQKRIFGDVRDDKHHRADSPFNHQASNHQASNHQASNHQASHKGRT
ncbi:RDD family protein [Maricaulis sp.]|uniref:RDD family protein n=1 Tax=Maricaulis sp. TaxID=1486257 RepID=UPI0025C42459|nr:RDD family protein [Maricaulis sp.]